MLTNCPECNLPVSDKALSCPHCGYPIRPVKNAHQSRKSSKRKRLPNGFGQISEIKNRNLRKPYRAMVTVGKTEQGRPICKPLKPKSYFSTYNDAYAALVEYNRNPYDLSPGITMQELYEKWLESHTKNKTESTARTYSSTWKYCSSIYAMRVSDLRIRHIKGCMEEGRAVYNGVVHTPTPYVQGRIKNLFNMMLDYAVEHEIVSQNCSRSFKKSSDITKEEKSVEKEHIPFTEEELQRLWDNVYSVPYVDVLLIQCYSGWRPQELGLIELENVDIENWTFEGGMKSSAGIGRIVPIHTKIRPLVLRRYEEAKTLSSKYLLNSTDDSSRQSQMILTYSRYYKRFVKIKSILSLNPEHRPHDGRIHFVTMAKDAKVDEYAIKYIVGHAIADLTERVYTKRNIDWLKEEIEKIK